MTTKWDSVADARLLVSILAVTNPTGISWVAVQQMMGDGFKKEGCRQHFTRLKAMYGTAGGQEASTVTTAPSAPRTRKRKAAALEDDEEIDTPATPVKSKKGKKGKRAKDATKQVSSNPVKNEETEDEEVLPDLAKTPVLAEESPTLR